MKKEKKRGKSHLRKGRILIAMAGIVIAMFITDSIRRDFFKVNINGVITVDGKFKARGDESAGLSDKVSNDPDVQPFTGAAVPMAGYTEAVFTAEKLSQGMLVLADDSHPATMSNGQNTVNLEDYKNDSYSVFDDTIVLDAEAAEALNQMMNDYAAAAELTDFIVYGTTNTYDGEDSCCPRKYADCATGYTVDLALMAYGSMISYDGEDIEGWIVQNCQNYGFIVRYPKGKTDKTGEAYCPWHLRYVGKAHAAAMANKNMCLEEYVEYLKGFTIDDPLEYTLGTDTYNIYTVPSEGDNTPIMVPLSGNYDISGDCIGSFIVLTKK